MTRDAAMAHLETYLAQVRRNLKGLSEAEVREVLLELRAHVLDHVEGHLTPGTVETALAALGSPRDVARANVTERVAAVMETDRGFFGVLAAVVRLAGLSLAGFVLFMVSLVSYAIAGGLLFIAGSKVVRPSQVGLWHSGDSWVLGTTNHPGNGPEMIGWSLVPLALMGGLLIGYLTWVFGRFCVRAMVRTGRRRAG
jgi:uncharacterized membrane protein